MTRPDPHSFCDPDQPETRSFDLRARVDFERRVLDAEVVLHLAEGPARARGGPLDLDTRGLAIDAVDDGAGGALPFALGPDDPVLGTRLRVELPPGAASVRVRYRTGAEASALQWLDPAQTAGKRHPYLFSQCQAIHARSVVPCQDTPRVRVTYTAELDVPAALRGLMAARFVEREERGPLAPGKAPRAIERWRMPQPIPPYLFAFAVGDLAARDLSPRARVWAEPAIVEAAAREFDGVEPMIEAAERLFGPYDWERFDLLVMPPSFPYGGMENPRLTFLTPTLIAGDRSLVNVVAHELAHSWTGNLVSNASAEHFWLNEGFTVYAERRILEATAGADVAALHAALGRRELDKAVAGFADRPALTRLRTRLDGVDPDEAFSVVPYEKGYLFLRAIEDAVGRAPFDAFLRRYMDAFRFRSITTEELVAFLERELPGAARRVDAPAWLDGEGVPAGAPAAESARLARVLAIAPDAPDLALGRSLSPTEWQLYLETVPRPAPDGLCDALDARFELTASANAEILCAWLDLAIASRHDRVLPRAEAFLGEVGRMKFLRPIYRTLAQREDTRALARATFQRWRGGYHPIARQVIGRNLA